MTKCLLHLILIIVLQACASSKNPGSLPAPKSMMGCAKSWEYFNLDDTLTGHVVFNRKAMGACGRIPFASLTIIKINPTDTIRVFELCSFKDWMPGDKVSIIGDIYNYQDVQVPKYAMGSMNYIYDPFECSVKKSYFGMVYLSGLKSIE